MTRAKIGGMPPAKPGHGGRIRDWPSVAERLKANPGVPILLPEFTQTPKVEALQIQVNYSVPPKALRDLGGKVWAYIRNSVQTTDPVGRVGDLWLEWIPEEVKNDGE